MRAGMMKQPPPPVPPDPELLFPSEFPNPADVEVNVIPGLNSGFQSPDIFT